MTRRSHFVLATAIALATSLGICEQSAFGQLRIVTYNTLDKPNSATDDAFFNTIFEAIGNTSTNGIAKRVDIVAVQEQRTFGGATNTTSHMADLLNSLYGVSTYTWSLSATNIGNDRVGFVYDTSSVQLLSQSNVTTGGPRPARLGIFCPVGYTSSDSLLYVYSAHLKAGDNTSDEMTRNTETNSLNSDAAALGAGAHVIFAGDLNIYDESDQAYVNLTGPGAVGNDPIALASWPTSGANSRYLTQSTRTGSLPDGGASGGLDDRFDHQVISDPLLDGEGLSYLGPTSVGLGALSHSYQSFGNDGVSYNQNINNTNVGRSQSPTVLDALYNFSDHLPVVADYQLPASMMATLGAVPTNVAKDSAVNIDVLVENIANVVAAIGADELDFDISVSGALAGSASGTAFALAGSETRQVQLNTSTLGPQSGTVTVTTASQGAANPLFSFPVNFTVGPGGGPVFGVIARDDFDSTLNLNSFSQNPAPGTFANLGDGFEMYEVDVSNSIPFNLIDDSADVFPDDTTGIIDSSTKLDVWFGVTDVVNPDNPSGMGVATWEFNVAGATGLEVSIDMGAMGDFEAGADTFDWTYSFDGAPAQPLFTSSVDEAGSATYTLADGDMFTLDDPLVMTNITGQMTQLSNVLQTITSQLTGSGNSLTIQLLATNDAEDPEGYAFDNIVVSGFTGGDFLEADFNEDFYVDAADLAQWEGDYGLNGNSDADGDGDSDGEDFLVWQQQFGLDTAPLAAAQTVPEPAAALLLLLSLPLACRRLLR